MTERKCLNCEADISDRHKRAKYCCDACRSMNRSLQTVSKVCEFCKKGYDVYIHRAEGSKFCSYACSAQGREVPEKNPPKLRSIDYRDKFPIAESIGRKHLA